MIETPNIERVSFGYKLIYQSKLSKARVGQIVTPHGNIDTPNFVAVGTNGTLKTLGNHEVNSTNLQLMFCNTYHLLLQPGREVVKQAGGLHKFINRNQPIITDSGGFQVFSLAYGGVANELKSKGTKKYDGSVLKINEEGVTFRSYIDGQKILLTPESTIDAQKDFAADIIIPLDELPPYHTDPKALIDSLDRTHRWEKRSLEQHLKNPANQAIYAVVHGGIDPELRKKSCQVLTNEPFSGFAIGGSLGCNLQEMVATVAATTQHLPNEAPNHLLGIGDLNSINQCVPLGIDTFDSAYPTRAARHGILFTKEEGPIKITKNVYAKDFEPVSKTCQCTSCQQYSRAYLHHLFKAKEPTAMNLASLHNVAYMVDHFANIRAQILCGLI